MGAVIAATALIVLGASNPVVPDVMWALTKFGNAWEGRRSERSEWWGARRILGDFGLIAIGVVVLVISVS